MTTAVHDFAELEGILKALPPPASGHVRVYRGQTANYPAMLPSACRPHASGVGQIWNVALLGLRRASTPAEKPSSGVDLIMDIGFWFKVLAQHYGPGSPYLDVTVSPEVALWFALNKAQPQPDQFSISMRGSQPISVKCSTLLFSKHADSPGWFYVLDVPRWDGQITPSHGELLDLSTSPPFVSTSLRILRQQGGMVMSDREVGAGDLAGYLACAPIAVSRPFAGCPFIDQDPHFLFPSPDEDAWYARLLQAPLVPQPDTPEGLAYKQSLGVYVVSSSGTKEDVLAALDRQTARISPLTRPWLRAETALRRDLCDRIGLDPETSTYLQVEVPLMQTLPPVENWNPSLLIAGLASRTQPRIESTGERLPAVSLENVLIEWSPLESAFVDAPADILIGSLWLVRHEQEFRVTMFKASSDGEQLMVIGPMTIAFSNANHCFELVQDDKRKPLLEAALPEQIVKAFYVALDLVRGLSDVPKPDAFPTLVVGDGETESLLLPLRVNGTVLTRAKADPDDMRLHFLRYADSLQPYIGPTNELPQVAMLTLKLNLTDRFEAVPSLRQLYGYVHSLSQAGLETAWRAEDAPADFSADIAEKMLNLYSCKDAEISEPCPDSIALFSQHPSEARPKETQPIGMNEQQEKAWLCACFDAMLAAETPADRQTVLLQHPVLLAATGQAMIQAERGSDSLSNAALIFLDQSRLYFWEHTNEYPFGHGPLEHVVAALRSGAISFGEAIQQARQPECSGQLSHTYLRAVMLSWVEELEADITFAWQAAEIALEAALAIPLPHLALDVRHAAAEGFIRLVHGGLLQRPDGRLYGRALAIGESVCQEAEKSGELALKADFLHELGACCA